MGYLIGEISIWLLIAFVIGVIIGWLIWGRGGAALQGKVTELERQLANAKAQCDACEAEKAELAAAAEAATSAKADLEKQVADAKSAAEASTSEVGRLSARLVELEKERDAAQASASSASEAAGETAKLEGRIRDLEAELAAAKAASSASSAAAAAESGYVAEDGAASSSDVAAASGDDTVSLTDAEADLTMGGGDDAAADTGGGDDEIAVTDADRPAALDAPQGTKDDLKLISGVGPKLEGVLNDLGVYHFWQIARWTQREVAWVDDYLSFKGRINRDKWIDQAKVLADGGETEFSKRNK